ncbi:MAG: hypothetical protein ACK422_05950, partial [Burkholderiales bacterium]
MEHKVASDTEKQSGSYQNSGSGQLCGTRQLPLFPRFGQPLRRRFFGPFRGIVGHALTPQQ